MPKHEALLTEDTLSRTAELGDFGNKTVALVFAQAISKTQHDKTLAWADARKIKCPCLDIGVYNSQVVLGCPFCHGSGTVTVGELVKEAGS